MHMADALLSPAVGGAMLAISGGLVAYSVRQTRKHFEESRVPLMGVTGAFVFAAQMINFAIPGTGSSGHIAGGVLLAALLGPAPAFLVLASVLLVQALFFADGGLLAWGANLFNMGFFGCFLAYPFIFRPIAGKSPTRGRLALASCVACIAGLELGALGVTVETLASGVTQLPFWAFAAAMLPIHLAIGLGEGLATAAVLVFVQKNLPDFGSVRLENETMSFRSLCLTFALAALVIGGGFSLIASSRPDGLEWSMERVAGTAELESANAGWSGAVYSVCGQIGEFFAILPDYAFPGSESPLGTTVSGIVGSIMVAAVLAIIGFLIYRTSRRKEADYIIKDFR